MDATWAKTHLYHCWKHSDTDKLSRFYGPKRTPIEVAEEERQQDVVDSTLWKKNTKWAWRPPDLSAGGRWHQRAVRELRLAADTTEDPEISFQEGLEMLTIHRKNYTTEGPKAQKLQLLWWMFPPEHWTTLQMGSLMNFLEEVSQGITKN